MTSSKPINAYNNMQVFLNVGKYYFQFALCYFKNISEKFITDDDDVTCMMTSSLKYFVDYNL